MNQFSILSLNIHFFKSCIIEGEIVPLDDKDNLMDFQSLLSRKQNYERLYVFDLLMLNNKSYMEEGLPSRRDTLFSNILDKITVFFLYF